MGNNPSVARFRADMKDFVNKVGKSFHQEVMDQAAEVVQNIKGAAPVETGTLRDSVHFVDVSTDTRVSALVFGGGKRTTKTSGHGITYDYAIATEFGTVKEAAEPFFYNTYRFYIQGGLEQFRETLADSVEENNKARSIRSDNYTSGNVRISSGYRGAVVIKKGKR